MSEIPVNAVIGAGAWGTAIALHLVNVGYRVKIWATETETVENIAGGENRIYLPGVKIPAAVEPTNDIDEALDATDIVFFAVPTQYIAAVLKKIPGDVDFSGRICVNLAKGIEARTGHLPSEIIKAALPGNPDVIALSGPSFATEFAAGNPTVLVAAGEIEAAERIQHEIASTNLRVYRSPDRLGVELGAALKNVLALAAGMADGLRLGENARAALIVRGLAEMCRLAVARGADRSTIFGIAGLGDLVLTCTSDKSRNYRLGVMIGRGKNAKDVLANVPWVAEGAYTAPAALAMARETNIELPITETVVNVLSGEITPRKAAEKLMTRPLGTEF